MIEISAEPGRKLHSCSSSLFCNQLETLPSLNTPAISLNTPLPYSCCAIRKAHQEHRAPWPAGATKTGARKLEITIMSAGTRDDRRASCYLTEHLDITAPCLFSTWIHTPMPGQGAGRKGLKLDWSACRSYKLLSSIIMNSKSWTCRGPYMDQTAPIR